MQRRALYLRSSTIGTTLPRIMSFLSDISTCRIRTSSPTATAMVMAGIVIHAFNIFHSFIIITAATRGTVVNVGDFMLDVNLFTLQQSIDNLSQLQILGAKPIRGSSLMLALGL